VFLSTIKSTVVQATKDKPILYSSAIGICVLLFNNRRLTMLIPKTNKANRFVYFLIKIIQMMKSGNKIS
jgi:hypothetical protein